ncbi:hypothetical protein [Azospirillum baldaniorum]|uniref:hypothetical protein n=1 Tax=Azospirillum baldaniorum TaxID=1064539 RepID=UPI0006967CDE|nr:hypothetical protein [Azospirillum baldaniorum]
MRKPKPLVGRVSAGVSGAERVAGCTPLERRGAAGGGATGGAAASCTGARLGLGWGAGSGCATGAVGGL